MNRRPREPLDAAERMLAAQLPRLHGRDEPDAALDARILSAARAAAGNRAATPRRRSWVVPTSIAASLVLAIGLAWQLRPLPSLPQPPAARESADASMASVQMVEAPAQAAPPPAEPQAGNDRAAPVAKPARVADRQPKPFPAPAVPPPPPPPSPAAPPPAAAPPVMEHPPVKTLARAAQANAPAAASEATSASMAKQATAAQAGAIAATAREARMQANEAERAADASTLDAIVLDDPGEDIPPATMDTPAVRQAWLERIRELLKQGRVDEARASLAEFRHRYPDARLPPELDALQPDDEAPSR